MKVRVLLLLLPLHSPLQRALQVLGRTSCSRTFIQRRILALHGSSTTLFGPCIACGHSPIKVRQYGAVSHTESRDQVSAGDGGTNDLPPEQNIPENPSSETKVPKPKVLGSATLPLEVGLASPPIKSAIQIKVKPVLKKRDYGSKYTKNNFITAVRAFNDFCLKPSDLQHLRKILRRSPHDDSEGFSVFVRSDVEAKALEVWGSYDALQMEKNRRKEIQEEYREKVFKTQKLLKEYKEFFGEAKPQSRTTGWFMKGPGRVVVVAIFVNGLNFVFKFIAWWHTGSASMFSECIHSLADTLNQAILALGIYHSIKNPDPDHPYGFSNMRYITSLISGVGIFMMGAGLSWYHGVVAMLHPHTVDSLTWVFCILGGSLVSEGATLLVAIRQVRKGARAKDMTFYEYVVRSRDPSTNVVLLEDAAAVLGLCIAGTCTGLTAITEQPIYDCIGSLAIGSLLGLVSAFLIYTNTQMLLGRSIQADQLQRITDLLENDPTIRAIHDVKATDMGMSKVRFKAEVDFDGRVLTRSYLERQDIEQMLNEIRQVQSAEALEAFMLKHGENIIDLLGSEIDRLEKELKKWNPEVRHVDLEIL